jgi:hypothetical protein
VALVARTAESLDPLDGEGVVHTVVSVRSHEPAISVRPEASLEAFSSATNDVFLSRFLREAANVDGLVH